MKLALVLACLLVAGCAVMPLSGGSSGGSGGDSDEANRGKIIAVLLFGAFGLWLDSQPDCKVPEKCEPEFTP